MAANLDTVATANLKFTKYVVHTKCMPDPRQLFYAVHQQVNANGRCGTFEIEMRHNVYNIHSTENIDVNKIKQKRVFWKNEKEAKEYHQSESYSKKESAPVDKTI